MAGASTIFYFLRSSGSKRRCSAYCHHHHNNMFACLQKYIYAFRQFVFIYHLHKLDRRSKPDPCSAEASSFHLLTDSSVDHRAGKDTEWSGTHLVAAATAHASVGKPTRNVRTWNNYSRYLFHWRHAG